ncbi:hypothetical protein V2G26_008023 [Clonostachys chloroleuca]
MWLTKTSDFSMPSFFCRDISQFSKMISVSVGRPCRLREHFIEDRIEILCPSDYLSTANDEETRVTNQFIHGLEIAFKTDRSVISIANRWKEDMPDEIENNDIAAYLKTVRSLPRPEFFDLTSIRPGSTHSSAIQRKLQQPWGNDRAESSLSNPRPASEMLAKLDIIKSISEEKLAECIRRCEVYRGWLLSKIFEADSKEKLKVMVIPGVEGKAHHSGEPEPLDDLLSGYASANMSAILQAPELAAAVGKVSGLCPLTGKEGSRPFSVSVIGPPDILITKVVQRGMDAARMSTQLRMPPSVNCKRCLPIGPITYI